MKPLPHTGASRGLSRAARIGTAVALTAVLSLGTFAPSAMALTDNYGREITAQSSPAQPAVMGQPYYGETLDAETGDWNEPVSMQWLRAGKPVKDEVFAAYTVSKDDLGKAISLRVTGDYSGKTRTSNSTAKATYTPIRNTAAPVITGNPVAGSVLTTSNGSWSQKGVTLTYQWLLNGQNIKGADKKTYKVSGTDKGGKLSVKVTASRKEFLTAAARSAQTAPAVHPDIKTAVPRIKGNTAIGQTLTAVPGSWTEGAAFSYVWKREGVEVGTKSTYVLTGEDKGYSLTVTVTGSKKMYVTGTAVSARTAEIGAALVANTSAPKITGDAVEGRTLTASAGSWSPSSAKLTYQWLRDGKPVGSGSNTYKLASEDVGAVISVKVSGSMEGYKSGAGVSAGTREVRLPTVWGKASQVKGTAEVTRTLTAEPGFWQDGAKLKFQWMADGTPISGANGKTLVLDESMIGRKITFAVTGSMERHLDRTTVSAPTRSVTDLIVVNAAAPTLAGSATEGSSLRVANAGTWGPGTVNLSYQWKRDGRDVPGATKAKYALTQNDVGAVMTAVVTGSKPGYESKSVSTADSRRIRDLAVTGSTPTIGGDVMVGKTLTAKTGNWTEGAKLSHQWLRSGNAIPGATGQTYKPGNADIGNRISVRVTGTKEGHTALVKTSKETHSTWRGAIEATKTPWIWGGHMDGYMLSARDIAYNTGGASLEYQWLRDGKPIGGATGTQYQVTGNDVGHVVALRLKATKKDYKSLTVTTAPTGTIVNSPILNTAKPTISGAGTAGSVMHADPGKWNRDGLKYSYQWYSDGKKIEGANRPAYRPTQEKRGTQLTVKVTAKKSNFTSGSAVSNPTGKIK